MTIHTVIYHAWQNRPEVCDSSVLPANLTFEQFCKKTFVNWTAHYPSLKCSHLGFSLLKKLFQMWAFPLPDNWSEMVNQPVMLLKLKTRCRTPYFWDRQRFYVFDSEMALELEMADRDFALWAKMF